MKIKIVCVGKTDSTYLSEGIDLYMKRINHYIDIDWIIIPSLKETKNYTTEDIKLKEAALLKKHLQNTDVVVLLDEKGKAFRSVDFSGVIQKKMLSSTKNLVFVIGGAFGFSPLFYNEYKERISLSSMTFSHQMIRLLLVEQIYRAFSIIHNEPYHNE